MGGGSALVTQEAKSLVLEGLMLVGWGWKTRRHAFRRPRAHGVLRGVLWEWEGEGERMEEAKEGFAEEVKTS